MNGKILKIANNDLYGNNDEREIVVFAAFNHVKYMNKYIIFTFNGEYAQKKLYYASLYLKENSLVVFNVKDSISKTYIENFITCYLANNLDINEYQIIDIQDKNKIELVSYNEIPFDRLEDLDRISIKRINNQDELNNSQKKPIFLYSLLIFMILLLVGITYIYFNPDLFTVELKKLECTSSNYDKKIELNYEKNITILFDKEEKKKSISNIDTYKFLDEESYYEFKENNKQETYFNISGSYKYDDENLELKIIYNQNLIIDGYKEILKYLKNEEYICVEGKYYE